MDLALNVRVTGVKLPAASKLLDISGGGALIQTRNVLKPGTTVEFELPRPGEVALRLRCIIRKASYEPGARLFRYALAFDDLSDRTHEELLRFIAQEQRRSIKRQRGHIDDVVDVAKLANRQRRSARVKLTMPIRYSVSGGETAHVATANDVSVGGMRITTDRVLRQEWTLTVRFTLPFAPYRELRMEARALPGLRETRGKYLQSLIWIDADPADTGEIERFIRAKPTTPRP